MIIWSRANTGNFRSYVLTSTAPDDGFYPDWNSADLEDELRWFFEISCLSFVFIYIIVTITNVIRRKVKILDTLTSLEVVSAISILYHFLVWLLILRADNEYKNKVAATYKNVYIAPDQELSAKAILKSLYQGCDQSRLCPGQY